MYLALTGARLKAADCVYSGVATHFSEMGANTADSRIVPSGNWDAQLALLADGTQEFLLCLSRDSGTEKPTLAEHREKIDRFFSANSVEAVLDALDSDGNDWSRETAKTIRAKSPTATKLAFRQIREGKTLDFDDCMRMEFRMVNRVVAGKDFYEGVRATIIDKDQAPKWQPARLEDVSDKDIDAYFAPLGDRELKL